MSKGEKIWMIVAAALVALGALLFAVAMMVADWDFSKLGTEDIITNAYQAETAFTQISIEEDTAKIDILPADDGVCRVVCQERKKMPHTVEVAQDTLVIRLTDTRKWYEYLGISFGKTEVTVYLPEMEYDRLTVETDTGDITVSDAFVFETINISADTADIESRADVVTSVNVATSTGDIRLEDVTLGQANLATDTGNVWAERIETKGKLGFATDTGDLCMTDVHCGALELESSTGNKHLVRVTVDGTLTARSSTGNVTFENSDAAALSVETSTGNVSGSLRSEKVFITDSATGRINVPKTVKGGRCEIITSTGNIDISLLN